jgi:RNA polymerase sigma factor (sigma-70 family)
VRQLVVANVETGNGVDLLAHYRASGAPEVFAQIMRAYGGMVYSVCFKVTKDAADAEDASQAVFLTLAVQCKTGAVIRYLGPWLKKVAKRTSLDLVRSRKRRTRRETVTAENRAEHYGVHPGTRSENGEIHQIIRAELDQLPAKYRMPLVLHYFGGLNHDEISREMRCTTAALGVRLHRARKMLGKRLSARGISLESAALGVAVASAVGSVINDRLIHSTTHAMVSLTTSYHPALACANLPAGLGMVPQLMYEVAHSMARARTRWATVVLALSVTMLGGAAEAVRHLPESIRPNLDFLSPTRALENLFRSATPVPRMQETPASPPQIAQLPPAPPLEDPEITPHYQIPAPSLLPRGATAQPMLSFNMKVFPPVVTPPIDLKSAPITVRNMDSEDLAPRPRSIAEGPAVAPPPPIDDRGSTNRSSAEYSPIASNGGNHVEAPRTSTQGSSTHAVRHREHVEKLTAFIPEPSAFSTTTQNVSRLARVSRFNKTLIDGTALTAGVQPMLMASDVGPVIPGVESPESDGLTSFVRPNQVFVHSGTDSYHWSDLAKGIDTDGVNSINLTVDGASNDGLLTIRNLSRGSTLAPPRPTGHTFIGLWQVDTEFDYTDLDMTVRYDHQLADQLNLNESILKLWVYDEGKWIRIVNDSFERDLEHHTLSGMWDHVAFIGVSAPEPTGAVVMMLSGAAMLLRRRRRST